MQRRDFLKFGGAAGAGLLLPFSQASADSAGLGFDLSNGTRTLNLVRPQSGETLRGIYMKDGVWVEGAYNRICYLMRDVKGGVTVKMDPQLIAILDWVQRYLAKHGYTQPIQLTSGYRGQKTNAALEGAAKNSLHMEGRAMDLIIPGLSADYLGRLMKWLSQGGVGTYDSRGFVHVDTGRIRAWRG